MPRAAPGDVTQQQQHISARHGIGQLCGIWGTLIVAATNDGATYLGQAVGVGLTGVFVVLASTVVWLALKFTIGVRCSLEAEEMGLDKAEIGREAYPEFSRG